MKKIKVMIVDDHVLIQAGLKQLLELGNAVEVIATANSGVQCLKLLEVVSPDIIFMDVRMNGITGIETTRIINKKYPNVKVIMLTIYINNEYVVEAFRAGAKGYILKNVTRGKLRDIIGHIMSGKAFLDPSVTLPFIDKIKNTNSASLDSRITPFTQRELEIIEYACMGKKDNDIADSLHISKHTVRGHMKNIFQKLNVSSKPQLITKAIQQGIVSVGLSASTEHINENFDTSINLNPERT